MYLISTKEVNEDWGFAWDCMVNACWNNPELMELIDKYEKLPDENHIKVVNCLINHFFSDSAIRLISMWGFGDTPAKDQMYLDIQAKLDQLKPYLEKYLG